jgi:hypothetical protein
MIDEAIQKMIPIIERDGACSIGWILKEMEVHHSEYYPPTKHMYKIMGKMCADGKYKPLLVTSGGDCWIQLNPEYAYYQSVRETNESVRLTNKTMVDNMASQKKLNIRLLCATIITGIFIGISAGIQSIDIYHKIKDKSLQDMNKELIIANHKIQSTLIDSIQKLNSRDAMNNKEIKEKANK